MLVYTLMATKNPAEAKVGDLVLVSTEAQVVAIGQEGPVKVLSCIVTGTHPANYVIRVTPTPVAPVVQTEQAS